jgi:hypothetical protein
VTWSAVEAQEKPEAPFRKKIDGSIVASGSAVVDLRRMNRTHADGEEGGAVGSAAESTTARVLCGLCMQCPSCSCRVNAHNDNANMSRVLVGPIQILPATYINFH